MNISALVMELMSQIAEEGNLQYGDTEIDLALIDPQTHTGVVQLVFHMDLMSDDTRKPHADGLRLVLYELVQPPDDVEQMPPDMRPKGWG